MEFKSDVVIGLEIHLQLNTETKLFCSCPSRSEENEKPNTRTCDTCLGLPGSKPIINKKAVEFGLKLALALGCKISPSLTFSRKSYFYPDLSKNFQISQHEIPLGDNGMLKLSDGTEVRIKRAHLEEDPAALVHPQSIGSSQYVLIDYNRSGNPLCEVVTEPDLTSPEQAIDFMKNFLSVAEYLDIFDTKNGVIKADANVSIKESGYVRSEIKNITGFREIARALEYEVHRQKDAVKKGEALVQDTRGWDSEKGTTSRLRLKESEEDYGYILDPDLAEIELSNEIVEEVRSTLPELASEKSKRFKEEYGISVEDANVLTQDRSLANLFEKAAKSLNSETVVRWLRHELMKFLNEGSSLKDIDEVQLVKLLTLVENKKITDLTARELLERLSKEPFDVEAEVENKGLGAVSDSSELEELCKSVINEFPEAVEDFKKGEKKSFNFLIGKVMQKTKGKASPSELAKIMQELVK